MKQVKAYIHHVRTNAVVQALADAGYRDLALVEARCSLKPLSDEERNYSSEGGGLLIGVARLELVCDESEVGFIVTIIRSHGRIGPHVSGWLHVSNIDAALTVGDAT